jgi:hypothetical protein
MIDTEISSIENSNNTTSTPPHAGNNIDSRIKQLSIPNISNISNISNKRLNTFGSFLNDENFMENTESTRKQVPTKEPVIGANKNNLRDKSQCAFEQTNNNVQNGRVNNQNTTIESTKSLNNNNNTIL